MSENEWEEVAAPTVESGEWEEVEAPEAPEPTVSVEEPKQETENVWLPDFNMTVGIPKMSSNEERSNHLYEQYFAQKYTDPSVYDEKQDAPDQNPNTGEGQASPLEVDGSIASDFKGVQEYGSQLEKQNPLGVLAKKEEPTVDDVRKPTETLPMNTALAVTSGFRQVASDLIEKPLWGIYEGLLRGQRAIYKYASNTSDDYEIKMGEKNKVIGRLDRFIEIAMQPEKYGKVTPQVARDQEETRAFLKARAADEKFHRRNYAYQMLNEFAVAGMTLASFFGSIGIFQKAAALGKTPAAIKYTGTAWEALKLEAMHAAKVMAPYAILTTKGGFSARMESAVMLSAFSMVGGLVGLTGWNRINASMLAILIDHAISIPQIKEMYKQSKGVNEDFWLLLAPLIAQNVAFGIRFQRTPKAQREAIRARRRKQIAEDFGVSEKTADSMISAVDKVLADEAKFAAKAEKEGLPDDVKPYAIDINPIDYNIPKKVDASGNERSKQVYPEFQNDRTIAGLDRVAAEISKLKKSSFVLNRDAAGEVIGRVDEAGYSPEHLRSLEPKRVRKNAKSDLDIVMDAIAGNPMTKKARNRVIDFLELQQKHDETTWRHEEDVRRREQSASEAISGGKSREAVGATIRKAREDAETDGGKSDGGLKGYHYSMNKTEGAMKDPVFLSTTKDGSELYRSLRGTEDGELKEFDVNITNPFVINGKDGAMKFIDLIRRAGFDVKIKDGENGWSIDYESTKPIRDNSPYEGDNLNDWMYVPEVREQLKKEGYDGIKGFDVFGNGDIEILVPVSSGQLKQTSPEAPFGSPENPVNVETPKAEAPNRGDTVSGFATDTIEKTPEFKEAADMAQKEGLLDLSRYFKSDMEAQKNLSQDLARRDPELLKQIAMGGEVPPSEKGLLPVSAYLELLNQAKANGDGKLGLELMRSPIADQISQAGSTLSSVSHLLTRDGVDPVATIKNIENALEKTGAKKNATQAERTKARQELETRMKLFEERAVKAEQALERLKAEKASRRALTGGEYGSRNKIITKERAEILRKEIRSQMQQLNANPIPLYAKKLELGAYHVEAGLREFKTWSEKMIEELGDKIKPELTNIWNDLNNKREEDKLAKAMARIGEAYDNGENADVSSALKKINEFVQASGVKNEKDILDAVVELTHEVAPNMTREEIRDAISGFGNYKPLSKDPLKVQIRDINGQWQQLAKIEALLKKQAPLKTGVERRTPSDQERALIKQVEELKKQTGITSRDPETQLKSALDAVKTRLKNQIKDMDAQIEAGKKIVPEKRSLQYDAEANALVAARDAMKAEFDKVFSTEMTPEKRIELATKAAERAVAEYERRIKENDLSPVKQKNAAWSPEISKLKARAQVLRDQIEAMKEAANPSKTPEQKAIDAMKKRLIKQAETYDVKLQNLDFSKKEKKEFVYDDEVRKLKDEADRARRAFRDVEKAAATVTPEQAQEIFRLSKVVKDLYDKIPAGSPEGSPENLAYGRAKFDYIEYADKIRHQAEAIQPGDWRNKPIQSVGKVLYEIPGVMKAVNASMDMGHLFRQGLPLLINDPVAWGVSAIKSIESGVKTIGGYEMMREHKASIYSRENHKNGVYAEHGLDLGKEENFISNIAEKAPLGIGRLVKASDVAYTVFLQRARVEYFDTIYKKLTDAKESTKGLGIIANSITGRGSFSKNGEAAANYANMAVFSIRNLKSRIDMLTGHLADAVTGKLSSGVAKVAMWNTIRSYVAIGSALVFAKIVANATGHSDDVELDPRSTGFGKIRIFNTDIDLTGGLSSFITLLSRFWGVKDRTTGIVSPTFSEGRVKQDFGDVLGRFANGKLSPFWGLGGDMISNMEDFAGNKLTIGSVASRFAPITPADVVKAFQGYNADGMTGSGLAKTLLASNIAFWGAGGSSNFPTPKQVVTAAKHVDSEIKRLNKNGEPEKAAALQERTQALTMAGSALEDSQNQINDLKRQISDARSFVQTDNETKKAQIEPLQAQIDTIQQVMDQTLKSIQED